MSKTNTIHHSYWSDFRLDFFKNAKPLLEQYWNQTHKVYICPSCKYGAINERAMIVHLGSKFGCKNIHNEYESPYDFKVEYGNFKVVFD